MRVPVLLVLALVFEVLPAAAEEPPCGLQVTRKGEDLMVPVPVQEVVPLGRPVRYGPDSGATVTPADRDGNRTGPPVSLGPTLVFDEQGLSAEEREYVVNQFIRRRNGGGRTKFTSTDLTTHKTTELWVLKPIEARELARWQAEGCPPGRFEIDQQSIDRLAARQGVSQSSRTPLSPSAAAFKGKLRMGTLDANGNLTPAARPVRVKHSAITTTSP